jgi:hypothetical protein
MQAPHIHRYSVAALHLFSFTALLPLLVVVGRGLLTGHLPPPDPDEGTGAHIFQLSIVALLPIGLVFLTTADWTRPLTLASRLAAPAVFVALAFGLLYYYEHVAAF